MLPGEDKKNSAQLESTKDRLLYCFFTKSLYEAKNESELSTHIYACMVILVPVLIGPVQCEKELLWCIYRVPVLIHSCCWWDRGNDLVFMKIINLFAVLFRLCPLCNFSCVRQKLVARWQVRDLHSWAHNLSGIILKGVIWKRLYSNGLEVIPGPWTPTGKRVFIFEWFGWYPIIKAFFNKCK